jgi:hypothetical protein
MKKSRAMQYLGLCLLLAFVVSACASTALGKAIQTADVQKRLVETSAVEFSKLHLLGDPRVTDAVYAQGKAAYQKYFVSQTAMATALASWKTVSSPANESTLTATLTELTKNINVYLALVGQFVDLGALKAKIGT